jgi:hypothetical protein
MGRPDQDREPWEWEAWEARRAKAPPGLDPEVRDARGEARILFEVARARLRLGEVPVDLAPHLAGAAEDLRLSSRSRLMAAELLGRVRVAVLRAVRASATGS